ncbi:hypothetical protein DYB30_011193, partial [Aphanomyces astaci]
TVQSLTFNVLKLLMEMDSQLFDQCSAQLDEREGKQQHTCEERRRKWLQLETRASLLYVPLPLLLRLDVLPFLMLYSTLSMCNCQAREGQGFVVAIALVFFLHALAFFSSEWSVAIKVWNAYTKFSMSTDVLKTCAFPHGVVVMIDPVSSALAKELCLLHWNSDTAHVDAKASVAIPRVWFSYQKLRFCVYATMDDDEGAATMVFHRLSYPTTHALQYYTKHTGYHSLAELNAASARWQDNEFDIPIPEFWELLKQHLVAPFFVFQVNEAMLSGESIPLRKEMLDVSQYDADTVFNMDENVATVKKHILYGGTKGNLMRTILFSAQRVTANNMESMLFILCLLCFALVASGMVLHQGLQDPTRNTFKLFLHCVMIITSVVPPELPMELSLAVTNSLLSLSKRSIFCTEPFRIPFAGKVDVVCFDKTGTLTSDALEMHGVAGLLATSVVPLDNPVQLVAPTALPTSVQLILAGCHSLVRLNFSNRCPYS